MIAATFIADSCGRIEKMEV